MHGVWSPRSQMNNEQSFAYCDLRIVKLVMFVVKSDVRGLTKARICTHVIKHSLFDTQWTVN